MPTTKVMPLLAATLCEFDKAGRLKGAETPITGVRPGCDGYGPRYLLEGYGDRPFLRMNSNGYLGLSSNKAVIHAGEAAVRKYGTGPGAVRFISGTWSAHAELERRLAAFHGRESAMLFSSAYATVLSIIPPLVNERTAIISDALNHNCIINGIALARPRHKLIYPHLDMNTLERHLETAAQDCQRVLIVTDGVFSMRGDHAPLDRIIDLAERYDAEFSENILVVVDDSHGVGAFGQTGRGTEEATGSVRADILVGTLGKAFGANGGYLVASDTMVRYLRETSAMYVYSNPIGPSETVAATAALATLDTTVGAQTLDHLRKVTSRFRAGVKRIGLETLPGEHPIVPLVVRGMESTRRLVQFLRDDNILATGLCYPVVPKGQEEIRFQTSADHTYKDIDQVLSAIARFPA